MRISDWSSDVCSSDLDHQQPRSHSRQYPTSSHAHAPVAEIKRIETRKYCLDESYWTRPIASTPHTIIRTKLAAFLLFAKSPQQSCGRFYYPRVYTSTVQRTASFLFAAFFSHAAIASRFFRLTSVALPMNRHSSGLPTRLRRAPRQRV